MQIIFTLNITGFYKVLYNCKSYFTLTLKNSEHCDDLYSWGCFTLVLALNRRSHTPMAKGGAIVNNWVKDNNIEAEIKHKMLPTENILQTWNHNGVMPHWQFASVQPEIFARK